MVIFFYPELTIKQTKLDENDIRFPEVSSSNTSDNSNEMSTFLELPKQNINASKGNYFISSDNGILKIIFEIIKLINDKNNVNSFEHNTISRLIICMVLK